MSKFSNKEQILFAKRLGFLMKAGVPILESLQILKNQMRSKAAALIFTQVISDVSSGQFLSTALGKFRNTFGDFAINIIRVGEYGGILGENLDYLAEELNKKQLLRRKIIGALFYPIFIVAATLVMTALLTIFVFPKVLPIFTSVNLSLPLPTKILIFVSHFLIRYGWLLLILLIAATAGFGFAMRRDGFRIWIERLVLKLPLFGQMARSFHLANFCRTMGLLLKGDTRLDEAVLTTATATENLVYKKELQKLAQTVLKGESVSQYLLRRPRLFPDIMSHMVAIGETAGNLSETFLYLAEMYENEVDDMTKNLSGLIEPVLMVFMGLLVGFVAISIITPIYSVTQKLQP